MFFIKLSAVLIEIAEQNTYQSILALEVAAFKQTSSRAELTDKASMLSPYILFFSEAEGISDEVKTFTQGHTSGKFSTQNGQVYVFQTTNQANGKEQLFLMNISLLRANQDLTGYTSLVLYSISVSVILLCSLSSWYLAKWLSTPIRKLILDIEQRSKTPEAPLFGADREDEIGMLASALEQSYQEIQALLQREQNFTRDVSHELRTPITLIKNTLALSPEETLGQDATKVVSQASQELEQTVEVLLALARQENLRFKQQALLPIIEKTVLNIYNSYPDLIFNVSIKVNRQLQVLGNRYLISLLCQNLVNNGFYHSNSGGMIIHSKGKQLIFENQITGSKQRPYYQGLGHGQYLVKRIAQEMHWQLQIEQSTKIYRVIVMTN